MVRNGGSERIARSGGDDWMKRNCGVLNGTKWRK